METHAGHIASAPTTLGMTWTALSAEQDVDVVDRGHHEVRLPVLETIGDVLAGGKDTVMTVIRFGAPSGAQRRGTRG